LAFFGFVWVRFGFVFSDVGEAKTFVKYSFQKAYSDFAGCEFGFVLHIKGVRVCTIFHNKIFDGVAPTGLKIDGGNRVPEAEASGYSIFIPSGFIMIQEQPEDVLGDGEPAGTAGLDPGRLWGGFQLRWYAFGF